MSYFSIITIIQMFWLQQWKTSTCHSFRSYTYCFQCQEQGLEKTSMSNEQHRHPQSFKELLEFVVTRLHIPLGVTKPHSTSVMTFSLLFASPSLFFGHTSPDINPRPSVPVLTSPHYPSLPSPSTQQPPPSSANIDLFPEFQVPVAQEG